MRLSKVYDSSRAQDNLIMEDVVSLVPDQQNIVIGNLSGETVTAADRRIGEINFMEGYAILNKAGGCHDHG